MDKKLVIVAPLLLALSSAPFALAQTKSADQKGPAVAASTKSDAKPVEDLLLAAQRLRDAIHAMLNEPAGPKRTEMIKAGDRALAEVEAAMVNLPPSMLTAQATESAYKKTADKLDKATRNLHEAVQALAKDPDSKRRDETVKKIKVALQDAQKLMHEIPRGTTAK